MPWLAVRLELRNLDPELAEAACLQAGAFAVTLSDINDDAVFEPLPGEVRLWPSTRLEALFSADLDSRTLLPALAEALAIEPQRLSAHTLADRVWEREWLRDFHAMRFGRRLWVCPRHEQVTQPDAVVVTLDPGLAFGTGTHASTALCLQWLDQADLNGRRVIDYGCGSGILAIAALKLGAAEASAFDIDPQALLATGENAHANGVAECMHCCACATALPRDSEVLLANILADVLISQAADLAALLPVGAELLLAGILCEQGEEVTEAYSSWFELRPFATRDGWIALTGKRNDQRTK